MGAFSVAERRVLLRVSDATRQMAWPGHPVRMARCGQQATLLSMTRIATSGRVGQRSYPAVFTVGVEA